MEIWSVWISDFCKLERHESAILEPRVLEIKLRSSSVLRLLGVRRRSLGK